MQDDPKEQTHNTGNFRITFPPPSGIELRPNQDIVLTGKRVTVRQVDDGTLEIDDPEFIQHLIQLGFAPGRNNSPEQIERILQNVPQECRQDFWDGFNGKPRT